MGGWSTPAMLTRYLGRDPVGCAERLRLKLAEAEQNRRNTDVLSPRPRRGRRDAQRNSL
jgi:hypothetical protein